MSERCYFAEYIGLGFWEPCRLPLGHGGEHDLSPRPHKYDQLWTPLRSSPIRAFNFDHDHGNMPRCPHGRIASSLTFEGQWECSSECQVGSGVDAAP